MKGLLLKDLLVIANQLKLFLILAIVLFGTNQDTSAFLWIIGAMLPLTSISYDDQSKWTNLALMMPVTRKQIVLSKYIFGLIGLGCVTILTLIIYVAYSVLGINNVLTFQTHLFSFCSSILLISIQLPLIFKLGAEKARIVSIILIGAICGLFVTITMASSSSLLWMLNQLPLLFCISIGLFFVSMAISIKILENKE